MPARLPPTVQGTRQGLAHVPRLPLRPPTQLDIKTKGALCKDLGFDAGRRRGRSNILQGHFPAENHAVEPQLGSGRHIRRVDRCGLRAEVQRQVGDQLLDRENRRIANQHGVNPGFRRAAKGLDNTRQLSLREYGVERQIHFRAVPVRVGHGLPQFFRGEIAGTLSRVEIPQPQIYRIGSRLDGRLQA